jgi:ribosome recycling factor
VEDIIKSFQSQMKDVLVLTQDDFKNIKTGRAKPSFIEDIKVSVESYGSTMELKELASITAPDPHMLVVSPWDKTVLKDIEKAIAKSELNLSPAIESDLIRVKIPPLTEESRKELVKLVYQKLESSKILMRQARNEAKSEIEAQEGKPGVSEDDIHQTLETLQQIVDEYTEKIDELAKNKEQELITV